MPVLCLEGPSAVGKTTVAGALERRGALAVPEVNQLFRRPQAEPATWYLQRQVQRWRMAVDGAATGRLALLDGDPFQPLWYNWAFGFEGTQDLAALVDFYRPLVAAGALGFPDRYFVLRATPAALRARKQADATRARRQFDRHLQLVEPQWRYFSAMQQFAPEQVMFIEADDPQAVADEVQRRCGARGEPSCIELFDLMVRWLAAQQFTRRPCALPPPPPPTPSVRPDRS